MNNAFNTADYYTCDDDAEGLSCDTPEEALEEWVDQQAERGDRDAATIVAASLTVTAYAHQKITDRELMLEAEYLIDDAAQRYLEEYGDPNGGVDVPAEALSAAAAAVALILRRLYTLCPPWVCEATGKRVYSAEEVALALRVDFEVTMVKGCDSMTMDKIARLTKLTEMADKLTTSANDLNVQIERLDQKLAAMKIGVAFWLEDPQEGVLLDLKKPVPAPGDPIRITGYYLGYAKLSDGWHLAVKHVELTRSQTNDNQPGWKVTSVWEPIKLTAAPRVVRMLAAEYLEELVVGLLAKIPSIVRSVIGASEKIAKLADGIH